MRWSRERYFDHSQRVGQGGSRQWRKYAIFTAEHVCSTEIQVDRYVFPRYRARSWQTLKRWLLV